MRIYTSRILQIKARTRGRGHRTQKYACTRTRIYKHIRPSTHVHRTHKYTKTNIKPHTLAWKHNHSYAHLQLTHMRTQAHPHACTNIINVCM